MWTLPGIELAEARSIVDARATRGGFDSLDELSAVEGVREETSQMLRALSAAASTER